MADKGAGDTLLGLFFLLVIPAALMGAVLGLRFLAIWAGLGEVLALALAVGVLAATSWFIWFIMREDTSVTPAPLARKGTTRIRMETATLERDADEDLNTSDFIWIASLLPEDLSSMRSGIAELDMETWRNLPAGDPRERVVLDLLYFQMENAAEWSVDGRASVWLLALSDLRAALADAVGEDDRDPPSPPMPYIPRDRLN